MPPGFSKLPPRSPSRSIPLNHPLGLHFRLRPAHTNHLYNLNRGLQLTSCSTQSEEQKDLEGHRHRDHAGWPSGRYPVHGACFISNDESYRLPGTDSGHCNVWRKRLKVANRLEGLFSDRKIHIIHDRLRRAIRIERRTKRRPIRQLEVICLTDKRLLPPTEITGPVTG